MINTIDANRNEKPGQSMSVGLHLQLHSQIPTYPQTPIHHNHFLSFNIFIQYILTTISEALNTLL